MWLAFEIETCGTQLEKHLLKNLMTIVDILHTHNKNKALDANSRAVFYLAGLEVLGACKRLSQEDFRWKLRPKHHMLHHIIRDIAQTGIIPNWSFPDETMNCLLMKTETVKSHYRTANRRILSQWSLAFAMAIEGTAIEGKVDLDFDLIFMRD